MPSRHHTSFTVEEGGRVYWFDAGETCSHTAHVAGIDLVATEAIFISHTHMDHLGGLPNLLWTLHKLATRYPAARARLAGRRIAIHLPDPGVFDHVLGILKACEKGVPPVFTLEPRPCTEGELYRAHGLRVEAYANSHMGPREAQQSFSFRIEAGKRAVVYSGDVAGVADFAPIVDPCDLLLMETGHHKVEDVCRQVQASGASIGELIFVHHGRAILRDPAGELAKARAILGPKVRIADDGLAMELK